MLSDVFFFVLISFSWDESSSISSGLSDGSDNLSSEEFNTSPTLNSLPTTPIGSRRNSTVVVSVTHTHEQRLRCTHTQLSDTDG